MEPEPLIDPRYRPPEATQEEIEAWADGEHKRREAWLAGPSEEEKQGWARRWRRRAALGLEESRLGPTPEEADRWAEREHQRRQAWLAGPSQEEKQDWARQWRRRAALGLAESSLPPTAEEADAWAERERQRRREWLAGPSEEEKRQWAHRRAGGLWAGLASLPLAEAGLSEAARGFLREAELAGKGSLYTLFRAPAVLWNYFVRAGRFSEKELYQQPRRGRVPF